MSKSHTPESVQQSKQAARAAGLRYISDTRPGIRREGTGEEVFYAAPNGEVIQDEAILARIRSLAIPPAYTDIWISPLANGHLQATGRDAKGRKQYRYHPQWRAFRDGDKYDRMMAFSAALPQIRKRVAQDLARPGLPREKVLATLVRLLETTLIRVGNEQYAEENQHYGLTTLHNEHVEVNGSNVEFRFVGKSGKAHDIKLQDRKLAGIVARLRDLPGEELFEYKTSDGNLHRINSEDVNAYLHEIAGEEFSAKDFRTWAGTVFAALALQELETFQTEAQAKKNIMSAIRQVSERLGNTPAVCRKCYVHPAILESYLEGTMLESLKQTALPEMNESDPQALRPEEAAVVQMLQQRLLQAG